MKAIILAAGKGTRLYKYTKNLPKGMLNFAGKTLLKRQIDILISCDISDIIIVTGYRADKIAYKNVKYYHNPNYNSTNMVESLFCAESEFTDEIIVSYADIIYEQKVLAGLISTHGEIIVTIDKAWEKYWSIRYGDTICDTESLILNDDGSIKSLGKENVGFDQIDGRYVGLIKFSIGGLSRLKQVYYKNRKIFWNKPWKTSRNVFQKAYMTDMLQALIDTVFQVQTYEIKGGWLEFDTNQDYERMLTLFNYDKLSQLIKL